MVIFGASPECRKKVHCNSFRARYFEAQKPCCVISSHIILTNVTAFCVSSILGGELFDRVIDDDFILTEKACVIFMRQICEGVKYMHDKSIIHLDLKVSAYIHSLFSPKTILFDETNLYAGDASYCE